jgi:glycosyltransferase involved in cell wall biosynthesis
MTNIASGLLLQNLPRVAIAYLLADNESDMGMWLFAKWGGGAMYSCRQAQQIAMNGQDRVVANVVSDAHHPGGFGAHARGFAAALGRQVPIAFGLPERLDSPISAAILEVGSRPFSQHAPTIWIGPVMPVPDLPGTKRIGWITWETTKVPEPYVSALRQFDNLWVPSKFCRDLLASSLGADVPVDVVQEGVDEQLFHPPAMLRSVSEGPFRFLAIGKWERRKGHEYVVQAFLRVFSKKDNVESLAFALRLQTRTVTPPPRN